MTCTCTPMSTCAECAEKMMDKLPPLPEPEAHFRINDDGLWLEARNGTPLFGETTMREFAEAYAAAAVAADRERRGPCQTCESLARTVMIDQTGAA